MNDNDKHSSSNRPTHTEKIYGKKTLGILIAQALAQAGLAKDKGTSKSTDYFRALIDRQISRTSGRLKLLLFISLLVISALGLSLGYMFISRRASRANDGGTPGRAIAHDNRYNVFMVAGIPKGSAADSLTGFCTAFAVSSDVLATCAHCLNEARENYTNVTAIMNGASKNRFRIVASKSHEDFKPGRISADVGLMRIAGHLPYFSKVANNQDLGLLSTGAPVYLYGFPGRLADASAPEATFIHGEIGRLTTIDLSIGTPLQNKLIQHSAFTSTGTSGSPLFDAKGHVIGINTGGYDEEGEKLVGYNVAMRVDLISTLFKDL